MTERLDHFLQSSMTDSMDQLLQSFLQGLRHNQMSAVPSMDPMASIEPAPQTPADTEQTSVSTWQVEVPDGDALHESWAQAMKKALQKCNEEYGGPQNYLANRFAERHECVSWLEYLLHVVPKSCNNFCFKQDGGGVLPQELGNAMPLMMHPAVFSYDMRSSVKGPSENDTVTALADEILKDGFVTAGDPILVTLSDLRVEKPDEDSSNLQKQSV